jgi:hypothetical protein
MTHWLRLAGLFGMSALVACGPSQPEQVAINRWLLCEECVSGELDSVVAVGDRAVGVLGSALQGPSAARYENVRRQAIESYDRLKAFAGGSVRTTRQDYVAHYLDNYVATYQSRAAIALARIGTTRARAALLEAIRSDSAYRNDVRRALGSAAAAVLTIVAGDTQSAPLDSFVSTDPSIALRDTTGQPMNGVRVVFVVDSGGGQVPDSIRRTTPNGIASVPWQLGPVDSMNVLRVAAAGRVVRFHAVGRPLGAHLAFTVQPTTAHANATVVPAVRVTARDSSGNADPSFSGIVTISISPGTGTPGAILSGTTVVAASAGVATFSNLSINLVGVGYRLTVTTPGLVGATSTAFNIN